MRFLEENHTDELLRLVDHAGEDVELACPWVTLPLAEMLWDRLPAGCALRVTFAWPALDDSPSQLDVEVLARLLVRGAELFYVPVSARFHAKVYVAPPAGAIVTSANLTHRGFSGTNDGGNAELGVLLTDPSEISDALAWIGRLNRVPVTREHIQLLRDWRECFEAWENEAAESEILQRRPEPPDPLVPSSVTVAGLERAKQLGMLRDYKPLERGYGRQAFELDLGSRRPAYRVRVITSVPAQPRKSPAAREYHFNVTRSDVEDWWSNVKNSRGRLKGVLLLPVRVDGGARSVDLDGPPPTLLPFDFLFRRNNIPRTAFLERLRGSGGTPTLFLTNESGKWSIRTPASPGRSVPLDGCLGRNDQALQGEWWRTHKP